ncbi:hypothetical protein [Indiicoccus explosivorum]|nr:hypothetical protein [Indiicoccus explosivorum]
MRELIGTCVRCGKEVYCMDGFLNGVYIGKELLCFACADETEDEE